MSCSSSATREDLFCAKDCDSSVLEADLGSDESNEVLQFVGVEVLLYHHGPSTTGEPCVFHVEVPHHAIGFGDDIVNLNIDRGDEIEVSLSSMDQRFGDLLVQLGHRCGCVMPHAMKAQTPLASQKYRF